jgi:hypothetical protein
LNARLHQHQDNKILSVVVLGPGDQMAGDEGMAGIENLDIKIMEQQ